MKKICFIANSLSYGRAEKIISFTASGFAERGDRVFLVNLLKNPGDAGRLDSRVTVIPAKAVKILYLDRLCEPDPRNKTKACQVYLAGFSDAFHHPFSDRYSVVPRDGLFSQHCVQHRQAPHHRGLVGMEAGRCEQNLHKTP